MLIVCTTCVAALIIALIVYNITRPDMRIFSIADQRITLYENGNFSARLAHNINISGTYTEQVNDNVTAISFTHGGNTVSSQIENNVLSLPFEWRAACIAHSHETEFPLRR